MTIRVAHLSALWQAGAGAMIRIHRSLLESGVESSVYTADPISAEIPRSHSLTPIVSPKRTQWLRKFGYEPNPWTSRIAQATKTNQKYEAFSPPVALERFDLSNVLDNADLLHLHWTGSFIDFDAFFRQVDVPVVWTLHDQHPYLGGFHYQGDVDAATSMLPLEYECRDIKREALANVRLAIAGNSDWNSHLAFSTGVLPDSATIETIYLPLSFQEYVPLSKTECKASLGIAPNRFVIGFACAELGNRRKGFVDLLAAIERLSPAVKASTTLLSFGRTPPREIRESVTVPWVHLGRMSGGQQQSTAYSAMDTFVIPSLEEAFGQTPLEAMACETAVIGTNVGGIPEMIDHGRTGLLTPARSPIRLSECIEAMFGDSDLRTRCGLNGRQHVIEHHSPKKIASQYANLYQRMLSGEASTSLCKSGARAA
jgi:glycosyltransferase involved in cell wall biosynthesis